MYMIETDSQVSLMLQ